MSTKTYTGGCLCGAVRFQLQGPIDVINYCHCSRCRRRTGSAFATVVHARLTNYELLSGEDRVSTFSPADRVERQFCSGCGSPLPGQDEEDDEVKIPAGLFDQDFDVAPELHIMTASKAIWFQIHDQLSQYEEFPEDW